jgi:cupin 2 domain-containing protein
MEWRVGNLLKGVGNEEGAERFETMVRGAGARIERIVSWGQASPEGFWYDQGWDEWVLVVQGRAGVRCEGEELRELGPGDWLWLPAGCRHRVEWTERGRPTVWLAVHLGERQEGPAGAH